MVEAAGVGLLHRIENKQLIDSKGPLEAQETANTRFSSTLQVHRVQQSSRVPSSVRYQNTDQARGEAFLCGCGTEIDGMGLLCAVKPKGLHQNAQESRPGGGLRAYRVELPLYATEPASDFNRQHHLQRHRAFAVCRGPTLQNRSALRDKTAPTPQTHSFVHSAAWIRNAAREPLPLHRAISLHGRSLRAAEEGRSIEYALPREDTHGP